MRNFLGSWKDYLYGESWKLQDNAKGLISQLSQRAGMLSREIRSIFMNLEEGRFLSLKKIIADSKLFKTKFLD